MRDSRVTLMPSDDTRVRFGPDEAGIVQRDHIRLLVWLDGDEAAVAGPAVDNRPWVVRAIRTVAREWRAQEPQSQGCSPPSSGEFLDCTKKELAVIIYHHHQMVVERGEIFPGSGLASHYIDVAGYRRHETEWVVARLDDLAHCIEHEEGFDYEF